MKKKHPGGRPEIEFNMETIELFGRFRATYETIAEYYGCSTRTIERKMEDEDGEFCRRYKKGKSDLRLKLSEAQVKAALVDGNPTMLVWLGKQHLGQTDKQDIVTRDKNSLTEEELDKKINELLGKAKTNPVTRREDLPE